MTYEEAIKTIEIAKAEVEWNYPLDYQEAFDVAIGCIEKQIPEKPLIINYNGRTIPYCPICKALLVKFADDDYREIFGEDWVHMNYCDTCGQRIDWSEVK